MYVPELNFNLIAARQCIKNGLVLSFGSDSCEFKRKDKVVLTAKVKFGLYVIELKDFNLRQPKDNEFVNFKRLACKIRASKPCVLGPC